MGSEDMVESLGFGSLVTKSREVVKSGKESGTQAGKQDIYEGIYQ
jgi:hypothetical protein